VRHKFPAIIAICFVLFAAACVRRVHDYTFSVTGFVTADDGQPLQGAEVTLELDAPVYEGIAALKSKRLLTNTNGSFVFMYLTGNATTRYRLTIRKEGFESQTLSGSSPPAEHHTVRLKNAQKTKTAANY
jgi:hypothetical protein